MFNFNNFIEINSILFRFALSDFYLQKHFINLDLHTYLVILDHSK